MGHWIFNDDHDLFRQSVKKFIENEITPHVREWERAGGLPRSLHKRMGEMGYLGVKFPEEYGGSGLDAVTEAVLIEDRKSTRLNSSHVSISYAVFCLKKKKQN